MKEATGELSMVVITILIVVAVIAIWNLVAPTVSNWVEETFQKTTEGKCTDPETGKVVDCQNK